MVIRSTLVGMRTGPLTLRFLFLAPLMSSEHTANAHTFQTAHKFPTRAVRHLHTGRRRVRASVQAQATVGVPSKDAALPEQVKSAAVAAHTVAGCGLVRMHCSSFSGPPEHWSATLNCYWLCCLTLLQVGNVPGGEGDADPVNGCGVLLHTDLSWSGLSGHLQGQTAQCC